MGWVQTVGEGGGDNGCGPTTVPYRYLHYDVSFNFKKWVTSAPSSPPPSLGVHNAQFAHSITRVKDILLSHRHPSPTAWSTLTGLLNLKDFKVRPTQRLLQTGPCPRCAGLVHDGAALAPSREVVHARLGWGETNWCTAHGARGNFSGLSLVCVPVHIAVVRTYLRTKSQHDFFCLLAVAGRL